jgi:MYXO-CTERM domain-containing protein
MKVRSTALAPLVASLVFASASLLGSSASAFPGFFAYQGKKPVNRSTHVVLMKKDATTVVSVMPDYEGDLKPFAVVLPVPDDVKAQTVRTLRRDFVDRVDQLSAPRFHEFWEMEPCEEGKPEQEWERDLKVKGAGFLGMSMGGEVEGPLASFKPGKEMGLTVAPDFKEGEQTFQVVSAADAADISGWLKSKGYTAPDGANQAVAPYVKNGMSFLVAEVDTKKVELIGGDRAVVSPIRYFTQKPMDVDSTLGLLNAGDNKQDLYVYVIAPSERYEAKNYPNVFPPTNIEVDFKVKERVGEFYAALEDVIEKQQPLGFLNEFAWSTRGCGQPCPNEPLLIHELLTLGGDVFETAVPKPEREPKAPDMTDEEKKAFKEIKDKKKQKEIEAMRTETARRKALLSRHHYMLSRMHHHYDKSALPKDLEVGPAGNVRGGVDVPQGAKGELPTEVKPAAESQLQIRFTSFHPSPAVAHCDKPERYRWGKAPRTYRGLRKIWVAQDMNTKNRTSHKPEELVYTPAPHLGITGKPQLLGGQAEVLSFAPVPSASAAPAEGENKKSSCSVVAVRPSASGPFALVALALAGLALRRKR